MAESITPCESRIPAAQRAAIIDKAVELVSGLLHDHGDELFTMYARTAALTESGKPIRHGISLSIILEPEGSAITVGVAMRSGYTMKDSIIDIVEPTPDMFAAKGEGA